MESGNRILRGHFFHRKFAAYLLMIGALILFILKIPVALDNPEFIGDSGHRMVNAHRIIFSVGEHRVWLPFLQLHIWVFYKLHLPYFAFKWIPCFYFLLALIGLGLLAYRFIGDSYGGVFFGCVVLGSFAYQPAVRFLSVNLYQEILEIALLYLLLNMGALDLKKSRRLFFLSIVALFVRETFFVYLGILSLIHFRKIVRDRDYLRSFLALWVISLCWITVIPFLRILKAGHWPHVTWEWISMFHRESSHWAHSFTSLGAALSKNHVWMVVLVGVLWFLGQVRFKKTCEKSSGEGDPFKAFSLLSLFVIYGGVLFFNPFTYGNSRMVVPLVSHLMVWFLIFYKESKPLPSFYKIGVRTILVVSLLSLTGWNTNPGLARHYAEERKAHREIKEIIRSNSHQTPPHICMVGDYQTSVCRFIALVLYMKHSFFEVDQVRDVQNCDFIIVPSKLDGSLAQYSKRGDIRLQIPYSVYEKDRSGLI